MSNNAIRFFAKNKKLKRVLRHRKKYIDDVRASTSELPKPTDDEIIAFVLEMNKCGLFRLAAIGEMAMGNKQLAAENKNFKSCEDISDKVLVAAKLELIAARKRIKELERAVYKHKQHRKMRETVRR